MRVPACVALAASLLAVPALADDYKPQNCTAAAPYAGAALRKPALDPAFRNLKSALSEFEAARAERLKAAFATAVERKGAPSMTAAVMIPGEGMWSATAPAQGGAPLHFWASAGKVFTAIAIFQLVEEGKLSLADPVSKWIDGVPNGDVITVEHLLNHTSGLFSANEDEVFRRAPHPLALGETLGILNRHGAMFCPGANWRYTNSGYDLLGAVLERVEKKTYADIITDRVIRRLKLTHMRAITPKDALTDIAAPSTKGKEPAVDPRVPGPAGAIASDAADMIELWRALLNGEVLKTSTVRTMFAKLYPMFGGAESYGLGVMAYELPPRAGEAGSIWLGHSGGAPGVKAVVAYSIADGAFVAVALTGDGSAEAVANLLLKQLRK